MKAIANEATHLRCQLDIPAAKKTLEQLIVRILWHLLHYANLESGEADYW